LLSLSFFILALLTHPNLSHPLFALQCCHPTHTSLRRHPPTSTILLPIASHSLATSIFPCLPAAHGSLTTSHLCLAALEFCSALVNMPYLEQTSASAQLDAAEIVNLKRILQLCKVPDVGPSPLDSAVTPEIRYTNALTTLEKSTAVFDEAIFQDAVFMETLDEDACDAELLAAAKERGVPDEYLPSNCMRNMPQSPSSTILEFLNKKDLPPTPEETDDLIPDMRTDSGSSVRTTSTDLKHSSRPSLSLPFRKLSTRSSMSDATRPGTSSSFLSTFSKSSTPKSPGRVKPRSSFMSLFRSSQKSPPILGPSRLDQSGVWIPVPVPSTSDVHSLASKSDKASTASVTSPSISISSRTSASSFADLNQFSWLDSRTLQRCTKTAKFITLQVKCQSEAKRFVDFCQHQKVALPLFIGRSRMYLESRIEIRIADLKKKVFIASTN